MSDRVYKSRALTLIFGVEIDSVRVLDKVEIEFTGHSDDDE